MVARKLSVLALCLAACQSNLGKALLTDDGPPLKDAGGESGGEPEPVPVSTDDDVVIEDDDVVDGDDVVPGSDAAPVGVAPRLVETVPESGATDIALSPELGFVFDRAISAGSGQLSVVESGVEEPVLTLPFDGPLVMVNARKAIVSLGVTLKPSTEYAVHLGDGVVTSAVGTPFAAGPEPVLLFSTEPGTPPTLIASEPAHMATSVALDTDLRLRFDQAVQLGDAEGELVLWDRASEAVVEAVPLGDAERVFIDTSEVSIDFSGELQGDRVYYVTVDAGAIESTSGVEYPGFSGKGTLAFTTGAAPVEPELELVSTVPEDDASGVDLATGLVFNFNAPISKGQGEVRVFGPDGVLFEAVDLASPSAAVLAVSLTVDLLGTLEPLTEYYVELDAGAVLAEDGTPYPGIADPTQFSFTTAEVLVAPPQLSATVPADDATDVPLDVLFSLQFDEPVSVGGGLILLLRASDDSVAASVGVTDPAVRVEGSVATVDFGDVLEPETAYYVSVGAGAFEGLTGAAFPGLNEATSWNFVTASEDVTWTVSPALGATDVDPAANIVLSFAEEPVLGEGTIEVRSALGVTLESATLDDPRVTLDGKTLSFDLDSLFTGDTEYTVLVSEGAITLQDGESLDAFVTEGAWSFTTTPLAAPGGAASGLLLWLDADYAPSLKGEDSVRFWADRSGLHNDVRREDSSGQPTLALEAMNGRSVVRFDGSDDSLSAAAAFALSQFEGFIVWQSSQAPDTKKRSIVVNGKNFEVNHGHSPSARNALSVCVGANCVNNQGWSDVHFVPTPVANTSYLWDFGFDARTTSIFARTQGSAPIVNVAPTGSPTEPLNPFSVGGDPLTCSDFAGCHFPGDVAELVLYSRVLSQEERQAVTAYLRTKWGTAEPQCGAGEELGPSGSCYFLSATPSDFSDAADDCEARGTGWALSGVRSEADHDFVRGLLGEDTWVGGSDSGSEGSWVWLLDGLEFWSGGDDGEAANESFDAWLESEPSESAGEDCLRYDFPEFGWAAGDCAQLLPALCEGPGR